MTNQKVKDKIKEAGGKELKISESVKIKKLGYCGHIIQKGCLQSSDSSWKVRKEAG